MDKIAYPFQFDKIRRSVKTSDDITSIRASVIAILRTSLHERITLPLFGSRLRDYVFQSINYTTLEMLKKEVCFSLSSQEPRIDHIQVNFQQAHAQNGELIVFVSYEVKHNGQFQTVDIHMSEAGFHI